ncbi:tyrosine-type recombinase/integrase [Gordonia paraffinivorans]|uniref:tyrosine-type recombinase/integrase n=1 Tax=Gordonia paraffinivorans TaxID=175628 RepID=UPI001445423B|nr:site-specific integrase [Gordonia paraffinivorans]
MKRNPRSSVEDRWHRADGSPSKAFGRGRRWRARYVDECGREHARGFARKVDAQAWLNEVTAAQVTGTYVDPKQGSVTFDQFYREWSQRQVWVAGTMAAMDLAARSTTFGDVPLIDLRPSHVEAWVKAMHDKGLQPSTIRTRFGNVRAALRAAERDRLLPRDPAAHIKLPRVPRRDTTMRIPTPNEVGRLMAACTGHLRVLRAFIAVCAFAGLRLGEVCGLRVGDIDFLRGEITVERQSQRGEIRPPKYGSSRTVYIPAGLVEELAEHVRLFCPGDDPDRWLWSNAKGPWTADVVEPRFARLREKVGVECRLHDLRHFHASGLIAAGCDVVTVQRAMGHKDATTTLNTYSHLWPKAEDRTRKAAEAMLAESTADALRTNEDANHSDLG